MPNYQNLSRFNLPDESRGRSRFIVQWWNFVQATVWALSPRVCYGWRRIVLRAFGAEIGKGVLIRQTTRITYPWNLRVGDGSWIGDDCVIYSLGLISIGANTAIAHKVYLCGGFHEFESQNFDQLVAPILIGDQCWLANDVFVAPGVSIGRGVVVGARSTVLNNLPEGMVCYGNPARATRARAPIDDDRI